MYFYRKICQSDLVSWVINKGPAAISSQRPPVVQFPPNSPSIHTTAFRSFKSSRSAWRRFFTQNKRSNRNSGWWNTDMYEILAYLPYQLVQDFFQQQYASLRPLPQTLMQYSKLFSFFSLLGVRICVHNPESPLGTSSWSPMKEHCGRLQIILAVTPSSRCPRRPRIGAGGSVSGPKWQT